MRGAGGLRASGRWHHQGLLIVYLAESPAGALLETCVHTSANDVPSSYTLLEVSVGQEASIEKLDSSLLPEKWAYDVEATREIGSMWLRSRRSTLLRVPSALVPETSNVLLNPFQAGATHVRIERIFPYPFDSRIKK